jgi:hypothetical protein
MFAPTLATVFQISKNIAPSCLARAEATAGALADAQFPFQLSGFSFSAFLSCYHAWMGIQVKVFKQTQKAHSSTGLRMMGEG